MKIKEVVKNLVHWKIFTAKSNIWKKKENLKNTKKAMAYFKERIGEVRRQEKLDLVEEQDFRKRELLEKYIAKMLYK